MSELKRILYVEDQLDIQMVAKIALESVGGFELKMCISGEEALHSAVGFAPDLFILDVMMPGLSGPETLLELQKIPELAAVPSIFMTGKVQPDEVVKYKSIGAWDVIAKPFDPMKLSEQVRAIWQQNSA